MIYLKDFLPTAADPPLKLNWLTARNLTRRALSGCQSRRAKSYFAISETGGLRLCIDYRALNKQTVKNCYPLPRIDETFDSLRQATIYTTLDLRSGCDQIRLDPDSISLMAIRTKYGLFEFLVVPFGLSNALAGRRM